MTIIGITGTPGAGKGTVVDYLISKYGFKHYSARAFITEEVVKQNLPETRENMRIVANGLREKFGPAYVAEQLYEQALSGGGDAILESLRNPGEIKALRSKPGNFLMLAVDAKPEIRYERILKRKSSTDNVSFEKFIEDEKAELNNPNPHEQHLNECIKMADAVISNDGTLEELQQQVDNIINKSRI